MLESRNSYGGGYVGTHEKGFEWRFRPNVNDPGYTDCMAHNCWIGVVDSGTVYQSEEEAVREGEKWMAEVGRSGTVEAIKATPYHFEY